MREGASTVCAYLRRPSLIDFRGSLAGVFFVSGCSFRCRYCHNPELIERQPAGLPWSKLEEVCRSFRDNWADAAVITGGEPTLAPDLPELINLLHTFGFKVKLDTNGSRPDVLQAVLPLVDYVAMDIKCALNRYAELTGLQDASAIAQSIELLKGSGVAYEFRTTVIESVHTREHMEELRPLVAGASCYVLQPFVPRETVLDEDFRALRRTPDDVLRDYSKLFIDCVKEVRF